MYFVKNIFTRIKNNGNVNSGGMNRGQHILFFKFWNMLHLSTCKSSYVTRDCLLSECIIVGNFIIYFSQGNTNIAEK